MSQTIAPQIPITRLDQADPELLDEGRTLAIARALYAAMVERLGTAIARVIRGEGLPIAAELRGVTQGLGSGSLAHDALLAAGFRESNILDLNAVLGPGLTSISTAYGAALAGLEIGLGLPVSSIVPRN